MKKYKLTIEETVVYNHEVVVELEDDADIDDICNKFDKYADRFDDVYYTDDYADGKVNIKEVIEDGSPDCEVEIIEYEEVTE